MRIILGVLAPDAGEVRWRGQPMNDEIRRRVGCAESGVRRSAYRIVGSDHTSIAIAGDSGTDDAAPRLDRTSCGTLPVPCVRLDVVST
jgi:hypothetical protein